MRRAQRPVAGTYGTSYNLRDRTMKPAGVGPADAGHGALLPAKPTRPLMGRWRWQKKSLDIQSGMSRRLGHSTTRCGRRCPPLYTRTYGAKW